MKLSVSNIAWETSRMDEFLGLIKRCGCHGLEFSPSMVWEEPMEATPSEISAFKRKVDSFGLEISSMHSLTFTRPDLTFFQSYEVRKKLIDYIIALGRLARNLEIPVMVFGSGKSRIIAGRNREVCHRILADAFYEMAKGLNPLGVVLLIEPLSKAECDSINNAREAMDLVKTINHKNFALHIDLKSSFAEYEDYNAVWSEFHEYIMHCHVANPGMKPPGPDCLDHYMAAKAIQSSGYDKYISLEISRVAHPDILSGAIQFVRDVYL